MQLARSIIALSCAGFAAACGTDFAIAVHPAPTQSGDASPPPTGIPDKPPPCASPTISGRVQRAKITLSEGVRYRRADSYFFGHPQDERIALAPWGNDGAMVAWLNAAGTEVHVTRLTQQLERLPDNTNLADYVVPGTELSGLVAHDDGFAVLTRRLDPGEPIGPGTPSSRMQATYLVRWSFDRGLVFEHALTGTTSIVSGVPEYDKRDYPQVVPASIGLSGRLAHNGKNYGAYFTAEGGVRDRFAGTSSDKFVQVDDSGNYVSGWRARCRQSLGGRIVPEAEGFTVFCLSDGTLGEAGIYAVEASGGTRFLTPQAAPTAGDYIGGNLGSALKTPSGYLVAWASRGIDTSSNNYGDYVYDAHEPGTMYVSNALVRVGEMVWPFLPKDVRPTQDAVNVHAVPYGDKVLLVWETIDMPQFRAGAGYGAHGGTHFQLVDHQGRKASEEDFLPAAVAPNGQDDIVQFPNRDVGWAYVPETERNFQAPVSAANASSLPVIKEIHFVRIPHCEQ